MNKKKNFYSDGKDKIACDADTDCGEGRLVTTRATR